MQGRLFLTIISAWLIIVNFSIAQQWDGYFFYSQKGSSTAYLLDTNGNVFHQWNLSNAPRTTYSAYLLEGGSIIRACTNQGNILKGGGMTGRIHKADWNGNTIWDYVYSSTTYCLHHDICPLPNGNVLMISYDVKSPTDATAAGCSKNIEIWSEKIIEVKPTGLNSGEIIWEWKVWDHLCQNVDPSKSNYVSSVSDHPELININYKANKDWLHMNGLDYNEELDQIAFSSHNFNEIYVIDHSTTIEEAAGHSGGKSGKGGDILYRWGNPGAYGQSGNAVFKVVHDAHWVPNGSPKAGYLVAFNNNGVSSSKSSVDMIYPPYDGFKYKKISGSQFEPLTYEYRHPCNGHSSNESNSVQLPNGNMVVNISLAGFIYEVDSKGAMIWSRQLKSGGPGQSASTSHIYKHSKCYVQGTIAPKPSISLMGDELQSSYGIKYQWFLNGEPINGATSENYKPTRNGRYYVQIHNEMGCESYLSDYYLISHLTSSVLENSDELFVVTQITDGTYEISSSWQDFQNFKYQVTDIIGNALLFGSNDKIINLSNYATGIYLLSIITNNSIYTKKLIVNK